MKLYSRIHFIAIGGAAMHQLALALHKNGSTITGSDDEIFEPALSNLKNAGLLPEYEGWNPNAITSNLDCVIVGMHAKADNPELLKAQELGLPIFSFPEFIYQQSINKQRIVIAGSHGKTTITSMVMHVLNYYNRSFDYLVGAAIEGFEHTVKLSKEAPIIIIEGDEYFTSPLEPTPKFLKYKHHIALVSGISWDHINVYSTLDSYVRQFDHLADASPKGGILVYNEDDEIASVICKKEREDVLGVEYTKHPYEIVDGKLVLIHKKQKYPLQIFGAHNASNISGAKALLSKIGITDEKFYAAIQSFKGPANRLQTIAESSKKMIIKDFAHAPSKVAATTKAVKEFNKDRKLVAIFELHTFSSLNKAFIKNYDKTLKHADEAIIYYNPAVLEHKGLPSLSPDEVAKAFNSTVAVTTDVNKLKERILSYKKEEANLLFMSSGNFGGLDIQALANEIV